MKKQVIIIGAGGHGRVIADIVRASGDELIGFLDDDISKETMGKLSDWSLFSKYSFIIGIGNNQTRLTISKQMANADWYTAIHPSAVISASAWIEEGTVIMPNSVVNAGAKIGKHCIINTGAIVEHDNTIQDFAHVSVGAKLG